MSSRHVGPRSIASFIATFSILHVAFWLFILFRDIARRWHGGAFNGEGLLGFIIILLISGPLTGVEAAVGYLGIGTLLTAYRHPLFRSQTLDGSFGAVVAYSLVWGILSLRGKTGLFDNLANSYLGLNILSLSVPWAPTVLGGLAALLTMFLALAVGRLFRQSRDTS